MTSPQESPSLLLDDVLIRKLRADLVAAGWGASTIERMLSPMARAALDRDQFVPAAMELESNATPAAVLTRLFVLGEAVERSEAHSVLPQLTVAGAVALGLVRESAATEATPIRATVSLRPHDEWWVASDLTQVQTGRAPREDYVLGIASASANLENLTLRDSVESALDLGCGCGILSLGLTRHADRVVATDISERACTFTRFNALLNEAPIDVRKGSFFEPLAGERFDLITTNPPFVITPQASRGTGVLEYRDSGMDRDQLIPWIIRESIGHLAPGGTLQMLANWEVKGEESDWAARPSEWIKRAVEPAVETGQSVNAWLVQRDLLDISQYAEWWIRDGLGAQVTPAEWRAEYRRWIEDFTFAGTRFVGLGSLAIRVGNTASSGATSTLNLCCEYLPEGKAADAFAVQTALDNLAVPADWESRPLLCAPDVREVRYFIPGSGNPELIRITQGRAGGRERSVTSAVAALIGVSDGEIAPAQVIPAIGQLLDQDEESVRAEIAGALPELLRSGVVVLV